jgi:hypothetical protein
MTTVHLRSSCKGVTNRDGFTFTVEGVRTMLDLVAAESTSAVSDNS